MWQAGVVKNLAKQGGGKVAGEFDGFRHRSLLAAQECNPDFPSSGPLRVMAHGDDGVARRFGIHHGLDDQRLGEARILQGHVNHAGFEIAKQRGGDVTRAATC